jgi:hypothetical protein
MMRRATVPRPCSAAEEVANLRASWSGMHAEAAETEERCGRDEHVLAPAAPNPFTGLPVAPLGNERAKVNSFGVDKT